MHYLPSACEKTFPNEICFSRQAQDRMDITWRLKPDESHEIWFAKTPKPANKRLMMHFSSDYLPHIFQSCPSVCHRVPRLCFNLRDLHRVSRAMNEDPAEIEHLQHLSPISPRHTASLEKLFCPRLRFNLRALHRVSRVMKETRPGSSIFSISRLSSTPHGLLREASSALVYTLICEISIESPERWMRPGRDRASSASLAHRPRATASSEKLFCPRLRFNLQDLHRVSRAMNETRPRSSIFSISLPSSPPPTASSEKLFCPRLHFNLRDLHRVSRAMNETPAEIEHLQHLTPIFHPPRPPTVKLLSALVYALICKISIESPERWTRPGRDRSIFSNLSPIVHAPRPPQKCSSPVCNKWGKLVGRRSRAIQRYWTAQFNKLKEARSQRGNVQSRQFSKAAGILSWTRCVKSWRNGVIITASFSVTQEPWALWMQRWGKVSFSVLYSVVCYFQPQVMRVSCGTYLRRAVVPRRLKCELNYRYLISARLPASRPAVSSRDIFITTPEINKSSLSLGRKKSSNCAGEKWEGLSLERCWIRLDFLPVRDFRPSLQGSAPVKKR